MNWCGINVKQALLCLSPTPYLMFCILVYVGAATVGAAAWWFMTAPDGPQLNYYQLVSRIVPARPVS